MRDINYDDLANVMASWEKLRTKKMHESEAGTKLYQHFFIRCPEAKLLIRTSENTPVIDNEETHARQGVTAIQMVDKALDMIGPDTEALTDMLLELGSEHAKYGVEPHMYQMMRLALCDTMEEILGSDVMTLRVRQSWCEVMATLTDVMMTTQDVRESGGV
ncbi:hypothetical protein MPSEU_000610900 [Mayamaea pseudoterrestris]|nr:hypothetical protein MPSEU_000610900 [Mayamaea pseudoterrestris]